VGNYQGKATGNYTWGQTGKGTTYVAVDVALFDDAGQQHGTITHKFFFSTTSQENVRISIEGLKLLGARMMGGDVTDLFGLGSTTAGIVTVSGQYGEEIKYINPPGPRARGVKDEEKLGPDALAAFRARMMPVVAGIAAASGGVVASPQPASRAPWQGQQRGPAPAASPAPWDQSAPPQAANPARDAGDEIPF
jgi:hypothetical protein